MTVSTNKARGVLASRLKERRGDVTASACPSRGVLEHVTSRWGVLVLIVLCEGTHRFSELRRAVSGVSEKMLAQTLRDLEHDGFVVRHVLPSVPPGVEYSLSPMGKEVAERVEALADWIETNMGRVAKARVRSAQVRQVSQAQS
jgi:DNA-binding HxlR family transcriptional regulator